MSWSEFAAGTIRAQLGVFRNRSRLRLERFPQRKAPSDRHLQSARGGTRTHTRDNPHRILSPVGFFVGRAKMKDDRPDVCLECQLSTFAANPNSPLQFRAQFWAQLALFEYSRATSYFFNLLIYSELSWLRGRDLNPRPLGYEPNELPDCSTPREEGIEIPYACQVAPGRSQGHAEAGKVSKHY